jgi:hypothetical protein
MSSEMARMQKPLEEKDDGLNDLLHYAKLETLSDQLLNNEGLEVCVQPDCAFFVAGILPLNLLSLWTPSGPLLTPSGTPTHPLRRKP